MTGMVAMVEAEPASRYFLQCQYLLHHPAQLPTAEPFFVGPPNPQQGHEAFCSGFLIGMLPRNMLGSGSVLGYGVLGTGG
jgi:hypothetical protein